MEGLNTNELTMAIKNKDQIQIHLRYGGIIIIENKYK